METIQCKCGWEGCFEDLRIKWVPDGRGKLQKSVACPCCGKVTDMNIAYDIVLN
jgi:hypothetical protein